ncbi:MAG: prepilin-type N-terminal cleavage/methylation domain-containing protein [Elusimicrobiaceae bacterium]|nr:prepilin-type N-terminal cleavage/methylation domain-containing protein [Elusimicrobiaceae bacterium]
MTNNNIKQGFTLIELLVVVLIIAILAAVALPQYKVAVAKAHLSKYLPMVRSIYAAEEAYYLSNGEYTLDLKALDIEIPEGGCTYGNGTVHRVYKCGDYNIGVYNSAKNVQIQTHNIGYLQYLTDEENSAVNENLKKGDILCLSSDDTAKKVCRSLGTIRKEKEVSAGGWTYMVLL